MGATAGESNQRSPTRLKAGEPAPKAITVVAIFLFIATGIAVIVGASLLFPNRLMDRLWELNRPAEPAFRAMGRLSGIALLMLGAGTFGAANGLVRRKSWAWWFAVMLFVVNIIGSVVSFIVTVDWLKSGSGVVISSAFLLALGSVPVRHYVFHSPAGNKTKRSSPSKPA